MNAGRKRSVNATSTTIMMRYASLSRVAGSTFAFLRRMLLLLFSYRLRCAAAAADDFFHAVPRRGPGERFPNETLIPFPKQISLAADAQHLAFTARRSHVVQVKIKVPHIKKSISFFLLLPHHHQKNLDTGYWIQDTRKMILQVCTTQCDTETSYIITCHILFITCLFDRRVNGVRQYNYLIPYLSACFPAHVQP